MIDFDRFFTESLVGSPSYSKSLSATIGNQALHQTVRTSQLKAAWVKRVGRPALGPLPQNP